MPDGWRTAQSSTLSLIPETSAAARTPPLAFVTMATGTRRTSAMTVSASLPSSTVRNRGRCGLAGSAVCTCVSVSGDQKDFVVHQHDHTTEYKHPTELPASVAHEQQRTRRRWSWIVAVLYGRRIYHHCWTAGKLGPCL